MTGEYTCVQVVAFSTTIKLEGGGPARPLREELFLWLP